MFRSAQFFIAPTLFIPVAEGYVVVVFILCTLDTLLWDGVHDVRSVKNRTGKKRQKCECLAHVMTSCYLFFLPVFSYAIPLQIHKNHGRVICTYAHTYSYIP